MVLSGLAVIKQPGMKKIAPRHIAKAGIRLSLALHRKRPGRNAPQKNR